MVLFNGRATRPDGMNRRSGWRSYSGTGPKTALCCRGPQPGCLVCSIGSTSSIRIRYAAEAGVSGVATLAGRAPPASRHQREARQACYDLQG